MAELRSYRARRDFTETPEPRGRKGGGGSGLFVIQKHAARRLHYDLRLEMDGVLKSWAVTRGPSLTPGEKRLAVHVEDHPLDYADFEGVIPKGHYGAGDVIVWDRGAWIPEGAPQKMYAKGHIDFTLDGEKLHGRWHLVRIARKPSDRTENWLLIKAQDEAARPQGSVDITEEAPLSIASGRAVDEGKKAAPKIRGAKEAPLPDFIPPALATLAARPPGGGRYLHEIKFDGYRIEARVRDGKARLLTRSGLNWTEKFSGPVTEALAHLPALSALLDGEIVVENGAGASDFTALQADLSAGRSDRFVYWVFDLLHLDGQDLTGASLVARKAALQSLLARAGAADAGPLRFSAHFEKDGELVLRHACRLSLEGIVSKLKTAPYRPGRSRAWLKSKCSQRQEFVIGGFTPSTTSRGAIGSLVLGVYENGRLVPVGRVGTGFPDRSATDLYRLLAPAKQPSPFAQKLSANEARGVVFVAPDHVAEVEFRAWTGDGHLRHAAYRGLRDDKPASDVVREAQAVPDAPAKPEETARARVRLTHPDRIYWPDIGLSKEGLADYYTQAWRLMAPFVAGRPLALLRCPEGIDGPHFFQKHPWKGLDRLILQVADPLAKKEPPYLAIDSLDGLIALVQGAALEIHPFGAPLADWERPDILIMDLDPGEGVAWAQVIAAARDVKTRLEAAGLGAFVKTSGGKGLHVCAPLQPRADWSVVKDFAKALAEAMAQDSPDLYVATIAKAKRRGRILLDYLRNQRGATAVAPYSTRARPGAGVSMPVGWEELAKLPGPDRYTALDAPARLTNLDADPWGDFRLAAAPLPQIGSARKR
jgi:bifunctional non-homologous end joining protein LigD